MKLSVTGIAGRVVIALVLVVLATGSVLATATTLPGPAARLQAEETTEPSAPPSAEPSAAPSAGPPASPDAAKEPADDEGDGDAPSQANLDRIVAKLAAKGITTTTGDLAALAAKAGVGGAVRVLVLADASGKTPATILAMFESGSGWGVIAKELGLHPGIGAIMGNGAGPAKAAKAEAKAAKAEAKAAKAEAKAAKAEAKAARAAERAARAQQRAAERAQREAGSGD